HRGHDHDRHPGADGELGDGDDDGDHGGAEGPQRVDGEAPAPAPFASAAVVDDHAGLAERERGEHADGVEGDQRVGAPAEGDDEGGGGGGEDQDAVGVDEPVAALGVLAGRVPVTGDDPGQAGEVGVGGVGGQRQDGG